MALDIFIFDFHENVEKSISLYLDEYDKIMEYIENTDDFIIIRKAMSDYYGEHEIYLNELENLNKEALNLKDVFKSSHSNALNIFIDDFLSLVDYALKYQRTIKFIGD